jgi:signal transduction histidine kinase
MDIRSRRLARKSEAGGPDRARLPGCARSTFRLTGRSGRACCQRVVVVVVLLLAVLLSPRPVVADGSNVLVLFSNGRLLPANVEFERGLRQSLSPEHRGSLFEEFLDAPRFRGAEFERAAVDYLRAKYRSRRLAIVVAAGPESLAFILAYRSVLFPGVPVVHLGVSRAQLGPLPADVIGVPIAYDFMGTIGQALRWHPLARKVVVVTGTSPYDRMLEARLRAEVVQFQPRATFEFLAGVPDAELVRRLGALERDTIVFSPGYFVNGDGAEMAPRESAQYLSALSPVPVYAPFDTFIGTGVVGGRMPSFVDAGIIAGGIIQGLLAGEDPASIRLPSAQPTALHVDWRQVERWGIQISGTEPDLIVHYRAPGFLDQYAQEAAVALVLFLLQSALTVGLVIERRRRRRAESSILRQRAELAHATRLQIGAQLAASIAHEINQPLGAILNNADAAIMMLDARSGIPATELRDIISEIRLADLRASGVIRRLRALLAQREVEQLPFGVEDMLHDVEAIMRPEAEARDVLLEFLVPEGRTILSGDRIQMQQVVINLLLNALDACADVPSRRQRVSVSLKVDAHSVTICVRDLGHGIPAEHRTRLFESFFTTRVDGMGMGLSISRTLVEAHGGRIWAEHAEEGTLMRVQLPRSSPECIAQACDAPERGMPHP